jgi:hypothetical protein
MDHYVLAALGAVSVGIVTGTGWMIRVWFQSVIAHVTATAEATTAKMSKDHGELAELVRQGAEDNTRDHAALGVGLANERLERIEADRLLADKIESTGT